MSLEGATAIVTGTSPNIGGGIAEGLATAGANVVCVDLSEDNVNDCSRSIRESGGNAIGRVCDVTDEVDVERTMQAAVEAFGDVNIVVNNAVIFNQKGVLDMALDEWRQQLDVILTGAFLFTKHAAHHMKSRDGGGSIINIISTAGHQGQPGNVGYCTGKSGLLNFTRSVAMELAAFGIRVNSLTPTATDPRERFERAARWGRDVPANWPANAMEHFRRGVPMQELPVPTDYANAVVFLVSDQARRITGTDLRVDAGAVARYWAWDPAT